MRTRPVRESLSKWLVAGLVPLCIWGMLSALILHLIEVRSLFFRGGEGRLRLAVLAFAAGVILVQRLGRREGREHAASYAWSLAIVMALFTIDDAIEHRLPGVSPWLVLAANSAIFTALWWVGFRITDACSVDSDAALSAAAEGGILGRWRAASKQKNRRLDALTDPSPEADDLEKAWQHRLPTAHPGRVIFWFSLFAVPAFGLGVLLFEPSSHAATAPPAGLLTPLSTLPSPAAQAEIHEAANRGLSAVTLGLHLFLYLWCALSLLFLASYGQLRSYFERREVQLPDVVGIGWLSAGFLVVAVVTTSAFLLPQPPSPTGLFVQDRINALLGDARANAGFSAPGGSGGSDPGRADGGSDRDESSAHEQARLRADHESGVDKAYLNNPDEEQRQTFQRMRSFFDAILKGLALLTAAAGVIATLVLLGVIFSGVRERLGRWTKTFNRPRTAEPRLRSRKQRKAAAAAARARLADFPDPFAATDLRDAGALARYLWMATLAMADEHGSRAAEDMTPYEFLEARPSALEGFEEPARQIARLYLTAEFAHAPLPPDRLPELRDYWSKLQSFAAQSA